MNQQKPFDWYDLTARAAAGRPRGPTITGQIALIAAMCWLCFAGGLAVGLFLRFSLGLGLPW